MKEIKLDLELPRDTDVRDAFDGWLRQGVSEPGFAGYRVEKGVVFLVFTDEATAETQNQALKAANTFDFEWRSEAQQKAATEKSAYAEIVDSDTLLDGLSTVISGLDTDIAALAAADTAALKGIVGRALARQKQAVEVLERILRGVQHIDRSVMN